LDKRKGAQELQRALLARFDGARVQQHTQLETIRRREATADELRQDLNRDLRVRVRARGRPESDAARIPRSNERSDRRSTPGHADQARRTERVRQKRPAEYTAAPASAGPPRPPADARERERKDRRKGRVGDWTTGRAVNRLGQRDEELRGVSQLLEKSKGEHLSKITPEIWIFLRDSLTVRFVRFLLTDILNENLSPIPLAILCEKDPPKLLPVVFETYCLPVIRDFLGEWPSRLPLPYELILERVLPILDSTDTGDVSTSLEIIHLLLQRLTSPPPSSGPWRRTFESLELLWAHSSATLSHKAKLLHIFGAAATCQILPPSALRPFLCFSPSTPQVVQVAVLRLCALYVRATGSVPAGLFGFLERSATDRDPPHFLAALDVLSFSFDALHASSPSRASSLLSRALHPPPRDPVEQQACVRVLSSVAWSLLPSPIEVLLSFLSRPHPSVVSSVARLLAGAPALLPSGRLDWFERGDVFSPLLPPGGLRLELLDAGLLPASAFPAAAADLGDASLFAAAAAVAAAGARALGLDFDGRDALWARVATDRWRCYADALPALRDVARGDFAASAFGAVVCAALGVVGRSLAGADLSAAAAVGLAGLAGAFACAFTPGACAIVAQLSGRFPNGHVRSAVSKFFGAAFRFEFAVDVARAALVSLPRCELAALAEYVAAGARADRGVLAQCGPIGDELFPTFLALRGVDDAYVRRCARALPFDAWVVADGDAEFIGTLAGVRVDDAAALGPRKAAIVARFPRAFEVASSVASGGGAPFAYALAESTSLAAPPETETETETEAVGRSTSLADAAAETETETEVIARSTSLADAPPETETETETETRRQPPSFSPYPKRRPCAAELRAFLWYSGRALPEGITWRCVEEYALRAGDGRLHAAALAHALRRDLPLRTERWASALAPDARDATTCVSFAFLARRVRKPWALLTRAEAALIGRAAAAFGLGSCDPWELLEARQCGRWESRVSAEAVLAIDASRAGDALIAAALAGDAAALVAAARADAAALAGDAAALIAELVLPGLPASPAAHFAVPPDVPGFAALGPRAVAAAAPAVADAGAALTEGLLELWAEAGGCDLRLFALLAHARLTPDQHERLLGPLVALPPAHPLYAHVEARRPPGQAPERPRPPSYARAVLAAFASQHPPPLSLEQKRAAGERLPRVFFELLPAGYEAFADPRFPPPAERALAARPADADALARARAALRAGGALSARFIEVIARVPAQALCAAFNTTAPDAAVADIAETVVGGLARQQGLLEDTIRVAAALVKLLPPFQLFAMVTGEEFLNGECFPNVAVVFRVAARAFEESPDSELARNWRDFLETLPERVREPKRVKVLAGENVAEALLELYSTP
jgi:hypothetical protein